MPRALLASAGLIASAGCAQIFGLDETSLEPPVLRFDLKRYAVGATVVVEPMDLAAGTVTYLVPDPTETSGFRKVPATSPQLGQWQGDIPLGTDAQLRFTIPDDAIVRLIALPRRKITALYGYLGRPVIDAAPAGATLSFNVSLEKPYAAAESLQWLSLGAWTVRDFAAAELPAVGATLFAPAASIPYTASTVLSRPPMGTSHPQLHADDALLVLRRNAGVLTGVFTAAPFELAAGANSVAGSMAAVPLDQSMAVTVDTTEPVTRMTNARPAVGVPAFNWSITAAPGAAAGFTTGPALATGALPPNGGAVTLSPTYGNPFASRSWPATFTWAATSTRTYQQPGGLPAVTLTALLNTITPVPTDGMPRDFSSCLPTSVAVQGATLITDGLTVTIDRSRPVMVSFIADRTDADLYGITLLEVVSNAGVATLVPRFESIDQKPSWTVPGDVFEPGKVYTMRASCARGGYPGLTTGDFERRELPVSNGFLDSGVFTVAL